MGGGRSNEYRKGNTGEKKGGHDTETSSPSPPSSPDVQKGLRNYRQLFSAPICTLGCRLGGEKSCETVEQQEDEDEAEGHEERRAEKKKTKEKKRKSVGLACSWAGGQKV